MSSLAAAALAGALVPQIALAQPVESARPRISGELQQNLVPGMADYTDQVLFGDMWLRPALPPRDRSLVTISALIATGRTPQLQNHLGRALDNGVSPQEASGVLTHLAVYSGWPVAVSALEVYDRVFAARNLALSGSVKPSKPAPAAVTRPPFSRQIAATAPKFTELTDQLVRADLWHRTDLRPRDRSLASIAALVAMGEMDDLAGEVSRGRANGL